MGDGRNWARVKRQSAARHIDLLLRRQGGQCHWCKRPIISLRALPGPEVRRNGETVWWDNQRGAIKSRLFATVDHVRPLSESGPYGGDGINHLENLVAACRPCNGKRSAKPKTAFRECWRCGARIHAANVCRRCSEEVHQELAGALAGEVGPLTSRTRPLGARAADRSLAAYGRSRRVARATHPDGGDPNPDYVD